MQPLLKKGQKIEFINKGDANGEVFIDQQMFRNVIFNLLSNAIKYSPEGSIIEFCTEDIAGGIEILVRDHGMGIPEEDKTHLFERFFRAKNATNLQGTGLGLNIVKRYIDLMDGSITFTSKEGEGTTFKISLKNTKQ